MANIYITEYANLSLNGNGQAAQEPALVDQKVAFTTAASSAAFAEGTRFVRLFADAACHVQFGAAPTATASHQRLAANTEYWRGVSPGQKVSAYDGSS